MKSEDRYEIFRMQFLPIINGENSKNLSYQEEVLNRSKEKVYNSLIMYASSIKKIHKKFEEDYEKLFRILHKKGVKAEN